MTNDAAGVLEKGKERLKGRGYDKSILAQAIREDWSVTRTAEELHTKSRDGVRHALEKLRKELPTVRDDDEIAPHMQEKSGDDGNGAMDYTPVWLGIPVYADKDTVEALRLMTQDSDWRSRFELFEGNPNELWIYDGTGIDALKKFLIRFGLYLKFSNDARIPKERLESVNLRVIPEPPSVEADELKWRVNLLQTVWEDEMEGLRKALKYGISGARVKIQRSTMLPDVWFDPEFMPDTGRAIEEEAFYFRLYYDPLAAVRFGYSRIIYQHGTHILLIDNLTNGEVKKMHSNLMWSPEYVKTAYQEYRQRPREEVFRERAGYWERDIPEDRIMEAVKSMVKFDPTMVEAYQDLCREYFEAYGLKFY